MIDLHSHILAGLDDGAGDLSESLEIARAAQGDGISTMVATPHVTWPNMMPPKNITDSVEALRCALAKSDIRLEVLPGAELPLEPVLPQELKAGRALTVNGGPYVLVELPLWSFSNYTERTIFDLQVAGYYPILAHPERCAAIQRDPSLLRSLVQRGALAQVTAESILGGFGQPVRALAEMFLKQNLVHIIATDAHSMANRPPHLRSAVERAAKMIGRAPAEAMVTTVPAAIVQGQAISMPEPQETKPRKRWGIL